MKKLLLILVSLVSSFFLGSCQDKLEWEITISVDYDGAKDDEVEEAIPLEYEEIMPITSYQAAGAQGGDCWGNYFFQFITKNQGVRIYDLSTKSFQEISIPVSQRGFVSDCHCNTVCFGTEYYDAEDLFPLIYVSTGYSSEGYSGALVYRLTQTKGKFSISLVQTLKFPVDKSSWTEFVPAGDCAYLCYTGERVIFKVDMPKLKDGDTVIIDRNSALETYQFSSQPDWMATSRNQDRLFHQGKIVFVSGVPQAGEASVFVELNLQTCKRERIIDFKKNGLTSEPESIFNWQGDLCVAFVDKIVKLHL